MINEMPNLNTFKFFTAAKVDPITKVSVAELVRMLFWVDVHVRDGNNHEVNSKLLVN
jgi:hypothetical protein